MTEPWVFGFNFWLDRSIDDVKLVLGLGRWYREWSLRPALPDATPAALPAGHSAEEQLLTAIFGPRDYRPPSGG